LRQQELRGRDDEKTTIHRTWQRGMRVDGFQRKVAIKWKNKKRNPEKDHLRRGSSPSQKARSSACTDEKPHRTVPAKSNSRAATKERVDHSQKKSEKKIKEEERKKLCQIGALRDGVSREAADALARMGDEDKSRCLPSRRGVKVGK